MKNDKKTHDLTKTYGETLFELELDLRGTAASLATDDSEDNRAALRLAARMFVEAERQVQPGKGRP